MSQWLPVHPTIVDPSTGVPLRALMIVGNLPVWPAIGFQDEDGSEGDSESQRDEENPTQETEDDEDEPQSGPETVSREEYDKVLRRMQAADRAKSEAEGKVKEFERKGQSDLEKAQSDAQDLKQENSSLRETLQMERIANAFLAENKVVWHNPKRALSVLRSDYMDGVQIDDNGNVTGIGEAIKKMAKDEAYLVNSGSVGSSGEPMNGKRKGDDKAAEQARDKELARRMPNLGRRIQN